MYKGTKHTLNKNFCKHKKTSGAHTYIGDGGIIACARAICYVIMIIMNL